MNVYEATQERIAYCLRSFDYVYVSFSGGKDSGVLLEMTAVEATKQGKRFGIFHMDYEAQYNLTTEYVQQTLDRYRAVADIYHICVPFKVTTCTSMFQSYWRPWQDDMRELWVRPMPDAAMTSDQFPFYKSNQWDYDFQREFGEWLCESKGRVCCLVGIRAEESLNRWRTAYSEKENRKHHDNKQWTTVQGKCVNAYPIIDWLLQDVWIANARNNWKYNHLYDLMHLAGVPIHKMRVASPFLSEGQETLRLYQVIEPDTWGKLIGRVNGVNFAGLYGGTTAMGWKNITKPAHFTWKQYMYFLLDTLPEETKQGYLSKLAVSMKFWKERGGCLSEEVITELQDAGVPIEVLSDTNYKTDKRPVRMDYLDDIDIRAFKEIPTYKRMCVCIIKNDHLCKYMGFSLTKDEMTRRKNIQEKYKDL
jgi:predicted phosphoadenosine phosphosulfate sulfurtransferase